MTVIFRFGVALFLLTAILFSGCDKEAEENCERLFGSPIPRTGLSDTQCGEGCVCKNYNPKLFTEAEIAELKAWTLDQSQTELTSNPYEDSTIVTGNDDGVCAIVVVNATARTYRLQHYTSAAEAEAAGAFVTHYGPCGLCSSLQDLAVYIENQDVGTPVRNCGIQNLIQPFNRLVVCIEGIGFTRPCSQIWGYNVRNTAANCLNECLADTFHHTSDGALSPCILCDEINSGPVFKTVAGRTRRNSGLPSTICRPCNEVELVAHNYPLQ